VSARLVVEANYLVDLNFPLLCYPEGERAWRRHIFGKRHHLPSARERGPKGGPSPQHLLELYTLLPHHYSCRI